MHFPCKNPVFKNISGSEKFSCFGLNLSNNCILHRILSKIPKENIFSTPYQYSPATFCFVVPISNPTFTYRKITVQLILGITLSLFDYKNSNCKFWRMIQKLPKKVE